MGGMGAQSVTPGTEKDYAGACIMQALIVAEAWKGQGKSQATCFEVAIEFDDSGATVTRAPSIEWVVAGGDVAPTPTLAVKPEPGYSARILGKYGPYAKTSPPQFLRSKTPPAEIATLLTYACRPLSDVAGACEWLTPEGWKVAPFRVTLAPGQWRGPCVKKVGVEAAEVAEVKGLNYSFPSGCK